MARCPLVIRPPPLFYFACPPMIIKLTAFWPCWVFKIFYNWQEYDWHPFSTFCSFLQFIWSNWKNTHTCFKNVCILHWFPTINTTTIMFEIAIASFFFQCSMFTLPSDIKHLLEKLWIVLTIDVFSKVISPFRKGSVKTCN